MTESASSHTHQRVTVAPDLRGWTAIAKEVGCSPRTARRYAKLPTDPLPVRRLEGGLVVARSAQVAGWLKRRGL